MQARNAGLDIIEVLAAFRDTDASREKRRNWDTTFAAFINATADGTVWEAFA
jgi:hypothetical protein